MVLRYIGIEENIERSNKKYRQCHSPPEANREMKKTSNECYIISQVDEVEIKLASKRIW